MKAIFKRFRKNEDGATAIEYGLIAALIAVIIIGAVTMVGTSLTNIFTTVSEKIDAADTNANK
ncbi:Flp family type IVb pilin [Pseudochrobactrum sp. sp1633]|uniref:Flp family type IVb pilin n=1 Tax=Pseudochrobactrum sp. sp1633 TaxID=3036706 RepID=UPI0025A55B50|nr:Flp family type IVb pilin [Pseudochrobactrum sp. sp1633]MDM8344616.1 Flp family type IVb pilin [Pseudochrobactrum sp. sp1633]HWD13624.1 Flp family type IVb pilin [Pseudochrobactrum sp.]